MEIRAVPPESSNNEVTVSTDKKLEEATKSQECLSWGRPEGLSSCFLSVKRPPLLVWCQYAVILPKYSDPLEFGSSALSAAMMTKVELRHFDLDSYHPLKTLGWHHGIHRGNSEAAGFLRSTFLCCGSHFCEDKKVDLPCSHYKAEEITGIR